MLYSNYKINTTEIVMKNVNWELLLVIVVNIILLIAVVELVGRAL